MDDSANPYRSPQSHVALARQPKQARPVTYHSGRFLAVVTILFLLASSGMTAVGTVWAVRSFEPATTAELCRESKIPWQVRLEKIYYGTETWERLFRYAQALVEGIAFLYFLCWQFQVHKNLIPLNVRGLTCGAVGAVGWWFAPVFSLFMPYRTMSELWRGSDPAAAKDSSGREWQQFATSFGVVGWWLLLIGRQIFGAAWLILAVRARTEYDGVFAFWIGIYYNAIVLSGMLAWVWVVYQVTQRQQRKYALMMDLAPQAQPQAKAAVQQPLDWTGLENL